MNMQEAFKQAAEIGTDPQLAEMVKGALVTKDSRLVLPSDVSPGLERVYAHGPRFHLVGTNWFRSRFLSGFQDKYSAFIKYSRNDWQRLVTLASVEDNETKVFLLRQLSLGMRLAEGALFPREVVAGIPRVQDFSDVYLPCFIDERFSPAASCFLAGVSDLSEYTNDQMTGFREFIFDEAKIEKIHLPQTYSPVSKWILG